MNQNSKLSLIFFFIIKKKKSAQNSKIKKVYQRLKLANSVKYGIRKTNKKSDRRETERL